MIPPAGSAARIVSAATVEILTISRFGLVIPVEGLCYHETWDQEVSARYVH